MARSALSQEEITRRLVAIGDVSSELAAAEPADKASLHGQLGLSLTCHPDVGRAEVKAQSLSVMYIKRCPRGDLNPHALLGH
jgi:site-specific DNA recombinase